MNESEVLLIMVVRVITDIASNTALTAEQKLRVIAMHLQDLQQLEGLQNEPDPKNS